MAEMALQSHTHESDLQQPHAMVPNPNEQPLRKIVDYPMLVGLFEATHVDNMEILKALIYAHDDILPLYDGSVRKRINLEILRRKNILLLISDLDISNEGLSILEQMYLESRHQPTRPESFYEVVWLPVVDKSTPWTEDQQKQFEYLQNRMPWYSVHHPSMVDPAVIKYINKKWKFGKKAILVVLDPQGRVANQNALHMMWIWGSLAFPFTSMREDALWREETWRLELLVDGIDQNILYWISEGRLICLYGGEDMEWIRKFTTQARNVSKIIREPIKLVYVGKSNPKERVRKNINIITNENLSHTWPDLTSIWFFWVRLEIMWYSKVQFGKTIDNDPIMKEILTILSFDDSGQCWAVISRGSAEMTKAKGETILTSFTEIDQWKTHVEREGFVSALNNIVDYPMLVDNMEILKALIYAHDDILPLYDGSVRKRINLEILRRKNILLLISDLDISNEELSILEQMYLESRHQPTRPESFYEVVWLPVVDKSTPWTEDQQKQFEYLQNRMPWYSVHHLSMVDPAVIKYIKEEWKFGKKAILVVLDPQGRVANQNALHMMWIWGSAAFPFTSMREDALWREETWRLELLVDVIDPKILDWMREGRLICLYGGEDMEWIRKFTTQARNVSKIIREPIKLVYVGKSNPKERVRNNISNIDSEKLSHTWPDLTSIWFFWVRLESMWYSKVQFGKTIDNDSIMKEILTILSFDDSGQCWAVISRGSAEMTKAKGETILTSFTEIDQWKTHVEREGFVPALNNIVDYPMLAGLFEATHVDNMEILKALIYAHDFILPLYDGSVRKRINLEILRRKNILLLISDLDISYVELSILEQIYSESQHQPTGPESFYEVVWLPVVDRSTPWTEEKRQQFEDLQNSMPWYSVHHPSLVDPAVIKYIKEKWKFAKKPILVVLDPQGRVANQNALHMMWIWGSLAFPFTSMREDALWREETWRLELLVDGIDPNILNWISEGRLICLYGGEDMEWIRKFTRNVGHAMLKVNLPIELVYVGKSNPKERVRKIVNNITNENLSHTWPDLKSIWFFWVRLESMWYSKTQHGKTIDKDPIIKEILTMLSFDDSGQGWAVISGGSAEMAKAKGETILTSFTENDQWKEHVEPKGFVPALIEYLHRRNHCLILPGTTKSVPDMVVCAECGSVMEKFIMFRCCTESEHQVNLPDGTSTCIE